MIWAFLPHTVFIFTKQKVFLPGIMNCTVHDRRVVTPSAIASPLIPRTQKVTGSRVQASLGSKDNGEAHESVPTVESKGAYPQAPTKFRNQNFGSCVLSDTLFYLFPFVIFT